MTKKLLIIDDNSTQLNILKVLFQGRGWEVHCVQSAKIGFEMIFDIAPDLIITDAVMPYMGGFQLIKLIREDETISKIPVIIYSVLGEANAKFYAKEEYNEYFLRKDNNQDELLALAYKIIEKFPLNDEYKEGILKASLERHKNTEEQTENIEENIENNIEETSEETSEEIFDEMPICEEVEENSLIDFDKLRSLIVNLDYANSDNILLTQLFNLLNKEIEYDLGLIHTHCFEEEEKKIYFDVRKIILSPILKSTILNKYKTKNKISFKQYAPNMDTVINEDEFASKTEFNISYKDEILAEIAFYSREEEKWKEEELAIIRDILYGFFKKRNIQRISETNKNEKFSSTYQGSNRQYEDMKSTPNAFFAIVQIINFVDMVSILSEQDLDILNSKISEKIIECTENNEQVYKNDEDEYNIVFFARDEKHARHRLEYILKTVEEITYEEINVQALVVGANCTIENNFNIIEAQKNARKTLDDANYSEKVVIYNE